MHEAEMCDSHKDSLIKYSSYMAAEKKGSVTSKLSVQFAENQQKNRSAITTLSQVALFFARQEIGLRGNRRRREKHVTKETLLSWLSY